MEQRPDSLALQDRTGATSSITPAWTFNEEQRARWNGADGERWARQYERLDRVLSPITAPLLAFAAPGAGSRVMDVGCGCGATAGELARLVGPSGHVTAIDISEPMLGRARERLRGLANVTCLLGDAASLPVRDLRADLMISRFGVMFFGDPVAAFTNLRTGLSPSGRVTFACWRPIHENPWLQTPLHAAYEHAPRLPKPQPEEPGPFSFADPLRVTRILTAAGFRAPSFTPLDVHLDLAAGGTLEEAVTHASETGPTGRALANQPEALRAAAIESIRRALAPHFSANSLKLPAAAWLVSAERGTR